MKFIVMLMEGYGQIFGDIYKIFDSQKEMLAFIKERELASGQVIAVYEAKELEIQRKFETKQEMVTKTELLDVSIKG